MVARPQRVYELPIKNFFFFEREVFFSALSRGCTRLESYPLQFTNPLPARTDIHRSVFCTLPRWTFKIFLVVTLKQHLIRTHVLGNIWRKVFHMYDNKKGVSSVCICWYCVVICKCMDQWNKRELRWSYFIHEGMTAALFAPSYCTSSHVLCSSSQYSLHLFFPFKEKGKAILS